MKGLRSTALAAALLANAAVSARAEDLVKRGAYMVGLMGCNDCHTPGYFFGKPDFSRALSGSDVGFFVPDTGYRWGPNLTPDKETGLGKWTDAEIIKAFKEGIRPDGRKLIPIMPYMAFASLTDADTAAIVAYLRSLPPIHHAVPAPLGPDAKPPGPFMAVTMPK